MKFENSETARLVGGNTPYISFPVLEKFPFIKHGFSTRLGGVSEGIFESMNLSFGRGDLEENVIQNYMRISNAIGVDSKSLVLSDQVHKTIIRKVDNFDQGKGIYHEKDYHEIDGLITNDRSVTLVTAYADCVPLYFVDPVKQAIGLTHAGWRGTVAGIGAKTIEAMKQEFQSDPKDIIVVIGPSICQDCYEVSADVAEEFKSVIAKEKQSEIITPQKDYTFLSEKESNELGADEKYQLNLWKANQQLLIAAGVLPDHITISGVCTCCNPNLFHSHRASHGKRGGLSALLALR